MANELTISVGAKPKEEEIKKAALSFFALYAKAFDELKRASRQTGQTIAEDMKDAGNAAKSSAEGVADALGEVGDTASEISAQVGKFQRLMAGLSSAFKADRLKAGIATIGIAVLSVVRAYQEWREERKRLDFEARQKTLEDAETRINRIYEERINLLQRTADLRANARDNARSEVDAERQIAEVVTQIQAAKERGLARSDRERNNLERELKIRQDLMENEKGLDAIRRKQEDLQDQKKVSEQEKAVKEKELARISGLKDEAQKAEKKWDEIYDGGENKTVALKSAGDRKSPLNPNGISQEEAQREYDAARQRRIRFEADEAKLKEELRDKDAEIRKLETELASSKFTKEKELLEKRLHLAKIELEANRREQTIQEERARRQRGYTERDMRRAEEDAKDERTMGESEMYSAGDYDTRMKNITARMKKANERKIAEEKILEDAATQELARINAGRARRGESALSTIGEAGETELSDDYKDIRSRQESRIQEERARLIELGRQKRELRFQGREETPQEKRARELEDRERENRIADEEEQDRRASQYGGVSTQAIVEAGKLKRSQEREKEYQTKLDEARAEELKRVNEDRKARGLSTYDTFEEIERGALSSRYTEKESRYEGLIQGEISTQRGIRGRLYDIQAEGTNKTAELMMQSRKGGSRLSAMGLGGGDSPQKETARHTRSMDQKLSKMISLLEPGDRTLGAGKSLGASWSIL